MKKGIGFNNIQFSDIYSVKIICIYFLHLDLVFNVFVIYQHIKYQN